MQSAQSYGVWFGAPLGDESPSYAGPDKCCWQTRASILKCEVPPGGPLLGDQNDILDRYSMSPRFDSALFVRQVSDAQYFCPELPRSPQPLELVCAGWEECTPDYDLVRRSFDWHVVEFIASGKGWLELQGDRHPLRTGTVFCYGPTTSLRITADREHPFVKYFAIFAGTKPLRAVARGPLRVNRVRQALYPQELQEILEHLVAEGNRKSAASIAITTDYLRIFFSKLHESTEEGRGAAAEICPRALASFRHAKSFLEENFTRFKRIEDVAHALGTTPENLCRLFRRFYNDTPYQLLLKLRVNLAVELLLRTDLLVKQVAERAGFDDPFHFSRVFKRIQRISPSAFQRMHNRNVAGPGRTAAPKRKKKRRKPPRGQ